MGTVCPLSHSVVDAGHAQRARRHSRRILCRLSGNILICPWVADFQICRLQRPEKERRKVERPKIERSYGDTCWARGGMLLRY